MVTGGSSGDGLAQAWRELSRSLRLAHDAMDVALRTVGLGGHTEFEALDLLARSPGGRLSQRNVQDLLGLSQSGNSRLVSRLEQAGLLRRATSGSDARAADLQITSTGRALVARSRPAFEAHAQATLDAVAVSASVPDSFNGSTGESPVLDDHTSGIAAGGILQFGESLLALRSEAISVADAVLVRDALEPLVLMEASKYRTDADIEEFEALLAQMATYLGDGERFFRADWALHRRLAMTCRNTLLRAVYLGLLGTLEEHLDDVVVTTGLRDYLRRRLVIHAEIIDAIASGRAERVREAAGSHAFVGVTTEVEVAAPRS